MNDKEFGIQLFQRILGERIAALETALGQIAAAGGPGAAPDALKAARKVAHALKGSGALYGYPELSQAGALAELASDADVSRLAGALLALMKKISAKGRPGNAVVLVLDAAGPQREALLQKLISMGHAATAAGSRAEAEKIVREKNVVSIVMNVILPDADGRTFIQDMRERPATASTPIFVILNSQFRSLKNECWQLGANDCFESPFDWDAVCAKVNEALLRLRGPAPSHGSVQEPSAHADQPVSRIPIKTPPGKPFETPPDPAPSQPKMLGRILLADDDELIGAIISHRLGKEGFEVVHRLGGSLAMETLKAERFDLVILDIQMPEIDGFNMLEQLRAMPRYRGVPVILLTALGKEQDIVRGFELGANDYIVKPFSPVEMLARVRRAMKQ